MTWSKGKSFRAKAWWRTAALGIAVALIAGLCFTFRALVRDPGFIFLVDRGGAKWIRAQEPVNILAHLDRNAVTYFHTSFEVGAVPSDAVLRVRAWQCVLVFLDGRQVLAGSDRPDQWKRWYRVNLGPRLSKGEHRLDIAVRNQHGPPCLLAYCKSLGIATGTSWLAATDQGPVMVVPASLMGPAAISLRFPRSDQALLAHLPLLLCLFVAFLAWFYGRARLSALQGVRVTPSLIRYGLLIVWLALIANNCLKMPARLLGFDWSGHMDYIRYVAQHWRVPLATQGAQMFQSPMFYIVAAMVYTGVSRVLSQTHTLMALRLIPLFCGMAQVEIAYRALRRVFPNRHDLQITGLVLGGLLPMNLYIAHSVSNEAPAGLVCGVVLLLALRLLYSPPGTPQRGTLIALGLVFGLALLTKVSAILLTAPLALVITYTQIRNARPPRRTVVKALASLGVVFGLAVAVAGWYYARNWLLLGRPFIGGWDARRGMTWWQDPGYRTLSQCLHFKAGLLRPIFAGLFGFWDGIYATFWSDSLLSGVGSFARRPHWNYGLMLASVWLALLPTVAILLGAAASVVRSRKPERPGLLFACGCAAVYFAAMFGFFLMVPCYAAIKSFYSVGLTAAYAILAAAGFDILTRNDRWRPVVQSVFACWAVLVYLTYFIW